MENKKKYLKRLLEIDFSMRLRGWTSGCVLLKKIIEKAEQDAEYKENFYQYILKKEGSIKLRKLTKSFGEYWEHLDFQNAVDSIDTAVIA